MLVKEGMLTGRRVGVLAIAAVVAASACRSEVTFLGGHGNAAGAGPTSTTVSTTTSTGGSVACGRTNDGFQVELQDAHGLSLSCATQIIDEPVDVVVEGAIVDSLDGYLAIDSCPPNADCAPEINQLFFSAPGLFNPVPVGAFVHVSLVLQGPWACVQVLQIDNMASWGGVSNPIVADEAMWLSAADGTTEVLPGSPFRIEPVALGCYPNQRGCPELPDDFVLRFERTGSPIDIPMGGETDWYVPGAPYPDTIQVRNLRSYQSGNCDDYWNWSWWAVGNFAFAL